jgi:hypothetical protein
MTATRAITQAPCSTCPFRKDRPQFLHREHRAEIAESLYDQDTFWCHGTYGHDDEGEAVIDMDAVQCAGALKALMLDGGTTQLSRISERLGLADLDKVAARGTDVWPLHEWVLLEIGEHAGNIDPDTLIDRTPETCSVVWDSRCEAPAGYKHMGGGISRGTEAAEYRCEMCYEPVCGSCRNDVGVCFNCADSDEETDDEL